MKVFTTIPRDLPPTALAIGTFDGVHLGHRALLSYLRSLHPHITVLVFSNHPRSVLNPEKAPPLILTPPEEKLALLQTFLIDALLLLPFTREIASLSYQEFLSLFPLLHLVLGEDDTLGKNREGTEETLRSFGEKKGFILHSPPKKLHQGAPISSSRIRSLIHQGERASALELLGHPIQLLQGTHLCQTSHAPS